MRNKSSPIIWIYLRIPVARTRLPAMNAKVRGKSLSSLPLTFLGCSLQNQLHTLFYVYPSLTVKRESKIHLPLPKSLPPSYSQICERETLLHKTLLRFSNQVKRDSGNGMEKQRHLDTMVIMARQESKLATIMIMTQLSKRGNLHVATKKQNKDALTELLLAV